MMKLNLGMGLVLIITIAVIISAIGKPLYHEGNIVEWRNFDRIGMVIDTDCRLKCSYTVRVDDLTVHNVKEFEIKRAR